MKKFFYLAFCLAVVMSLGCVTLTYPTITDNAGAGVFVVNTNGKAHIQETTQTSQSTGSGRFEHVAFIDQGPGDHQKLTGYELSLAVGTLNFHSDTYCNPDWTGCAWVTNTYDPDTVPCTFSTPGVSLNLNCLDISAIGLCFGSRTGECGRSLRSPGLSSQDIKRILEEGVPQGNNHLIYTLSSVNTSTTLISGTGSMMTPHFAGSYDINLNIQKGLAQIDLNSIVHEQNLLRLASIADSEFASGTAHIEHNGVSRDLNYSLLDGAFYRRVARNRF